MVDALLKGERLIVTLDRALEGQHDRLLPQSRLQRDLRVDS